MKKPAVLLTFLMLVLVLASAAFADSYPFEITHRFYDGESVLTEVHTEQYTLNVEEGSEFWLENLSGNGTQYVYRFHVDGYDDRGRWNNNGSKISGKLGTRSYSDRDADGKKFAYKNRYIGLALDNGAAEYRYYYQPSLTSTFVDQNGEPLTGENGELKNKNGKTVSNPAVTYYFQGQKDPLAEEFPGYQIREYTQEGARLKWDGKNWRVPVELHQNCAAVTLVYDKLCTVKYTDGVPGEEIFPDEITENILAGSATPAFSGGTPKREGYVFGGWLPAVADTVADDTVYTAQWIAEERFTVTYTDGANGKVFPDQVTADLAKGADTPAFTGGKPQRNGWKFKGWSPGISETVQGNVTYTAEWEKETAPESVPVTGDDAGIGTYFALLFGSLAAAVLLAKRGKE